MHGRTQGRAPGRTVVRVQYAIEDAFQATLATLIVRVALERKVLDCSVKRTQAALRSPSIKERGCAPAR